MAKNNPISDKNRDAISIGHATGKRGPGDSTEKTNEALAILGHGKPYGHPSGPLGDRGRPAHDKALYPENTN